MSAPPWRAKANVQAIEHTARALDKAREDLFRMERPMTIEEAELALANYRRRLVEEPAIADRAGADLVLARMEMAARDPHVEFVGRRAYLAERVRRLESELALLWGGPKMKEPK